MCVRHVSALVALLLMSWAASAAEECTTSRARFQRSCTSGTVASDWAYAPVNYASLCTALRGQLSADPQGTGSNCLGAPATGALSVTSITGASISGTSCRITVQRQNGTGGAYNWSRFIESGVPCPDPEECSNEHETTSVVTTTVPDNACNPMTGCKMVRGSGLCIGGSCIFSVTHTTESCGSTSDPEVEPSTAGESCATGDGFEICKTNESPPDRNCGFVNGEFTCLDSIGAGECRALSDGARICSASAPMPPVPDNGTPGVPATPDEAIDATDASGQPQTLNYYSSTTVGGSSRPVGDGSNPYEGERDEDSDGEESAVRDGLMCEEGDANCSEEGAGGEGDDPRGGWQCWAEGEGFGGAVASCYEAASETMWDTLVDESSLLSVADATASAFSGGGSCPSDVVTLAGEEFDFWEVPCTFLAQVESFLGPLMLLFWGFVSLRILLTIPGGE